MMGEIPKEVPKGGFERVNEARFDDHLRQVHGPQEVANLIPSGVDLSTINPAYRGMIQNIYSMNAGQVLDYVNGLAARLAVHAAGAGVDVAGLVAPASGDVASRLISAQLQNNPEIQKNLTA
jgi:hypothetical protein